MVLLCSNCCLDFCYLLSCIISHQVVNLSNFFPLCDRYTMPNHIYVPLATPVLTDMLHDIITLTKQSGLHVESIYISTSLSFLSKITVPCFILLHVHIIYIHWFFNFTTTSYCHNLSPQPRLNLPLYASPIGADNNDFFIFTTLFIFVMSWHGHFSQLLSHPLYCVPNKGPK